MELETDRTAITPPVILPAGDGPQMWGHPRGLWTLNGTELWDRISFHGMAAMLVLYMTGDLLQPGRMENIAGFAAYRHFLQSVFGAVTPAAIATQTFGLYYAVLTCLPLVGGWLGDKFIQRRVAVTIGALTMTAGHFALAFDRTFLVALGLLVVGAGLLRGNLKSQIRALYAAGDRRLADAFQIYSMVVNFGAFIAPLLTGAIAKYFGWHAGFAVAGFGMLIGLVWYLAGSKALPPDAPKGIKVHRPPLTRSQKRDVLGLFAMWPISVCFWTAQAQIWNVYNLWVRDHVDMVVRGFAVAPGARRAGTRHLRRAGHHAVALASPPRPRTRPVHQDGPRLPDLRRRHPDARRRAAAGRSRRPCPAVAPRPVPHHIQLGRDLLFPGHGNLLCRPRARTMARLAARGRCPLRLRRLDPVGNHGRMVRNRLPHHVLDRQRRHRRRGRRSRAYPAARADPVAGIYRGRGGSAALKGQGERAK
jgi:hypothetical protein